MSRTWRRNLSVDQVSELDIPRRGGAPLPPPPKSPLRKHRSAGDPLSHHHASPAFSPDVIQEGQEYPSPLCAPSGEKNWERRFHSFRKDQSNITAGGGRFRFSTEFSPRKNSGGRQRRLHMRTWTPTQPTSDVRTVKAEALHTRAPSVPILTNSRKPHHGRKKDRDGDEAVRGGNIFTNMFKSSASSLEKKPKQEQLHRRIRSMDTLDETRRNGSEVAHSPRLVVKSAHHARSLENTPKQKPLHRRIRSMNTLDETRRNGSSRRLVNRHSSASLEDQSGPLHASTDGRREGTLGEVGVVQTPIAPASHVSVGQENSEHLSTLFSTSKMQTTGMKKAFTKFHNSSRFSEDATSAYLGDDLSSNKEHFTMINNVVLGLNKESAGTHRLSQKGSGPRRLDLVDLQRRLPVSLSRSVPSILEMESEDGRRPSHRVLCPIQGTEEWKPGRRYLIAPAALMHCPVQVFSLLSGGSPRLDDATTNPNHIFGPLCLGTASMTYVGGTHAHQRGQWSYGLLSLFQNYLVEYDEASPGMIPRGYAHLQHAKASFHPEFPNALTLEFYDSPCAKTDKRVLLIRIKSKSETERWVTCLNRAATLNVESLYEYDKENPCGRGRYATVYRAKRRDSSSSSCGLTNGYSCAVKIIDKSKFWGRVANGVERADTLVRETAVQATLSAQHGQRPFLKLHSFFETSESVVIETELLEGTDLFHYISKKGVLEEDEASNFAFDLLTSLETMNRLGLAHRDVKPANILMCDKEKDGVFVKLGDFGMSTFVGVDGLVRGRCGTPGYVAPEIFEAGVHRGYGNKVDVFSAGVTLYVMLCGYEPFYGESDAELIAANRQAELDFPNEEWGAISTAARDLVEKMLQADPKLRISAAEALQHDWIRDRRSSPLESSSSGSLLDKSLSRGTSEPNAKDQSACAIS